jgi:hypothetical protein
MVYHGFPHSLQFSVVEKNALMKDVMNVGIKLSIKIKVVEKVCSLNWA